MKKIVSLIIATLLIVACFAGCGAKQEELVMCTNPAFPPYEFVDDNGEIVGIDAEIAAAIAEKLNKKLVIKDMAFESLIPAVQGGSADFAMAGMTVTDERKLSVNFSNTYAKGIQTIVVKEGSNVTIDNMGNFTIGVQSGTTGDIYCTDDFGQDHVKQYENAPLAIAALVNGQVDCVVIDNEPAKNFAKTNEGLKLLETAYSEEDYAIAINKENTQLLSDINKALDELKADGTIDKIITKYIPAE